MNNGNLQNQPLTVKNEANPSTNANANNNIA